MEFAGLKLKKYRVPRKIKKKRNRRGMIGRYSDGCSRVKCAILVADLPYQSYHIKEKWLILWRNGRMTSKMKRIVKKFKNKKLRCRIIYSYPLTEAQMYEGSKETLIKNDEVGQWPG